jgi:hypothetical protein
MPLEFPATLLPDEKIHRFHLVRYGLGLVLAPTRDAVKRGSGDRAVQALIK